jgi:hypothetical protein
VAFFFGEIVMNLKIFLDESGNEQTPTFTIAGFYLFISNKKREIEILNRYFKNFLVNQFEILKLQRNFENLQKNIKIRNNFEKDKELK